MGNFHGSLGESVANDDVEANRHLSTDDDDGLLSGLLLLAGRSCSALSHTTRPKGRYTKQHRRTSLFRSRLALYGQRLLGRGTTSTTTAAESLGIFCHTSKRCRRSVVAVLITIMVLKFEHVIESVGWMSAGQKTG